MPSIWRCPKMGVPLNHSIWMGFSIIKQPTILGTAHFRKPPFISVYSELSFLRRKRSGTDHICHSLKIFIAIRRAFLFFVHPSSSFGTFPTSTASNISKTSRSSCCFSVIPTILQRWNCGFTPLGASGSPPILGLAHSWLGCHPPSVMVASVLDNEFVFVASDSRSLSELYMFIITVNPMFYHHVLSSCSAWNWPSMRLIFDAIPMWQSRVLTDPALRIAGTCGAAPGERTGWIHLWNMEKPRKTWGVRVSIIMGVAQNDKMDGLQAKIPSINRWFRGTQMHGNLHMKTTKPRKHSGKTWQNVLKSMEIMALFSSKWPQTIQSQILIRGKQDSNLTFVCTSPADYKTSVCLDTKCRAEVLSAAGLSANKSRLRAQVWVKTNSD